MSAQKPRVIEPIHLDDGQQYLDQELKCGRFTPFLGAGASSLRPFEPNLAIEPWCSIWSGVLAIRDGLENASQLDYLRSFAEHRLRIGVKAKSQLEATPEQMQRKEKVRKKETKERPLLDFQRSLVRLASEMGRVFGETFATSHSAVGHIRDLAVELNPEGNTARDLVAELLLAADLASKLPAEAFPADAAVPGEAQPPQLLNISIYERMLMLAVSLISLRLWNSKRLELWRGRHRARIDQLGRRGRPGQTHGNAIVSVEMLEWLPELLWYTLRFWTPLLPTTGEMAFELTLRADLAPPRKADLAQAAEALNLSSADLADIIKPWFTYCHQHRAALTDFHVAIAASLQHSYDLYACHEKKRRERQGAAAEPVESYPPPVAFTTNFDRCIEDVFRIKEITHHVIFPVRPHGRDAKIKWKISTRPGREDDAKDTHDQFLEDEFFEVRGPMIVKLHGSPLDSAGHKAEHWLVLSELGYLEAVAEKNLPPLLESQLAAQTGEAGDQEPNRSLWFLGYSITDWNVRLRLYEHLRYTDRSHPPEKKAIDRALDSFRMAILGSLGVGVYLGDLNRLPSIFLRALEQVPHPRSAGFERLMRSLKQLASNDKDLRPRVAVEEVQ